MLMEWQLKKIRLKNQKKLNENNLCLYKSISCYIQNSYLIEKEKEEILNQILDMMLQGQLENKSVNEIIGDDYQEFCDSVIKEFSISKSRNFRILNYVQNFIKWTLITSFFILISKMLFHFSYELTITLNEFLVASAVSLFILPIAKRKRQKNSSLLSAKQRLVASIINYTEVEIYAIINMFVFVILFRFIITKTFGAEILYQAIPIVKYIPVVLILLLIIGIIEFIKRVNIEFLKL